MRTEYGFVRTECDCPECSKNCRFITGMFAPPDVPRLAARLGYGYHFEKFAFDRLLASPGALVARAGMPFRIPTLVPATKPDGSCIWLERGRCTVHEDSPFGCAFFDVHQSQDLALSRSRRVLQHIYFGKVCPGHDPDVDRYLKLHASLFASGRVAERAEVLRQRMAADGSIPT